MFNFIIICFVTSIISIAAHAESVYIFKVPLRAEATSLPSGEKFYFVNKGSLLPALDFSEINSWEKRIGPLKKENEKATRQVEIKKLPEIGIKEGDKISFYNSKTKVLDSYVVKNEISIQLIPSPYDSESFYISFNVSLTDSKNVETLSQLDYHEYDGLAYLGSKYQLNPINVGGSESEKPLTNDTELNEILTHLNLLVMKNEIKVSEVSKSGKRIFVVYKRKTGERTYLLKTGPAKYIQWDQPQGEYESIHHFGNYVKECELTLVYQNGGSYYVILLFNDKIEKYKVLYDAGYKG